jgi:hypothetical protein
MATPFCMSLLHGIPVWHDSSDAQICLWNWA